jgi:DHA2 family metal-tetracycline-proton antiporter-like MFS transporter
MPSYRAEVIQKQKTMREGLVIFLLSFSIILVIMNTMMFNLALPEVARSYGLSVSASSWIVTGYSIVFAISSIAYSRLSDFIPIRRLFMIGLVCLSVPSIAGFFINSFVPLLVSRLLQASGAGSILALSLVLITRYVPLKRRGKAMATIMSAVSLGLGLGPVVGGIIVEYLDWHYLFFVTSITLFLVPLFALLLPLETSGQGSFDVRGAFYIGVGITGLLYFLTNQSWVVLMIGLLALVMFVIRIHRVQNPFVQPSLFRDRSYLTLGAIGIVSYLFNFTTLFLIPQILVHYYNLNSSISGLIIFPGSLIAMIISGRVGRIIDRFGNQTIIRYTPFLLLTTAILFALFASRSYIAIIIIYMIVSINFTFLSSSISNEMSRILPTSMIGSGLGLFQLLQFFSGAIGVAVTASALVWQKQLPLSFAYDNIYWGLSIISLIPILCSYLYLRFKSPMSKTG